MKRLSYEEAVNYIENSASRGSILGLSRVLKLCELLGSPHNKVKCIHIAGTNGKGSTSCFISSVLKEAGYKTGQYYSPAMTGIKDHYMINGIIISNDEYSELVSEVKAANEELFDCLGESATQFELETAMAFLYFEKSDCDIVVLETGLGGRDDATNICGLKEACVFTSISYDHTAILGDTLEEIAKVKSGIITGDSPVVIYDSGNAVTNTILAKCKERNNDVRIVSESDYIKHLTDDGGQYITYGNYSDMEISLKGMCQFDNAAVALATFDMLNKKGYGISDTNVRDGLKKAYWPFRMECINQEPLIYVDGAHNPDAAMKLSDTLELDYYLQKELILVLAMFKDKDCRQVIKTLVKRARKVYCITVPNPIRAFWAENICELAKEYAEPDIMNNIFACNSIEECVEMLYHDFSEDAESKNDEVIIKNTEKYVLACGSLSYLDDFKKAVVNAFQKTV